MEPEDKQGLSKVHPEVLDERRQQFFQLFDAAEKPNHFVASRRRWLERQGEKAAGNISGMTFKHQGVLAKAPSVLREDFENSVAAAKLVVVQGRRKSMVAVEDRRRRRVTFEETSKGILRNLEDSEDLKVSVTDLQEQLGISRKQVSPSSKLPSRQGTKMAKHFFELFRQEEKDVCNASLARCNAPLKVEEKGVKLRCRK